MENLFFLNLVIKEMFMAANLVRKMERFQPRTFL